MRYALVALVLFAAVQWFNHPTVAVAQMLGAPPGYANATLKPEHDRQKLQAKQRADAIRALQQQQAAQAAQRKP